ncbi:ATP-binding protein [Erwiniaceae bacterium BAC15a-03b]|uniref:Sensor histidine kinase EnvZ n=1 Tax=Winslowiella arboricola TaxID=2978220 RepID=A0A9J6PL45_9GAMM|nr:ATP-binding protein [Winslowiella arboricola]MCU5772519.1 ATP-binding protein [Winslowiella arboricola]MCU5779041.1 ATP-binding protein [Winslowiella arboricola]
MTWLQKRLPKRMANQLVLLLVLALLLTNIIAIVAIQLTGALIHPVSRAHALERLSIAYQAAQRLAPADTEPLLQAINTRDARFWIAARPDVPAFPMRSEEQRLAADLASLLPATDNIMMQLERTDGGVAREHLFRAAGWQPLRLRTSVELPDGRYLNGVQHPMQAYEWRRLLAYALPVTSVPVLLMVMFFIRRVVHPVKTLAEATERVSRGEWIKPLPLRGPQEARELTQAFNLMQERLARHVEGRTRMLAAVSHDLNTPITELRLTVELMAEGPDRDDMLESLQELSSMVSETLKFVRGDALQEQTSSLSVSRLLDDLARRYRTLGQPVTWQGGEATEIRCRPLSLKRALTNLIDNALMYAGDATLSLHQQAGGVRIEVLDHGPGIAPASLAQAFEPFVQLSHMKVREDTGAGGGLGLGLSIARATVHAHGGELILENRPPAGLCAIVILPEGQKVMVLPNQKVRP